MVAVILLACLLIMVAAAVSIVLLIGVLSVMVLGINCTPLPGNTH
jgi:hypothetical protein